MAPGTREKVLLPALYKKQLPTQRCRIFFSINRYFRIWPNCCTKPFSTLSAAPVARLGPLAGPRLSRYGRTSRPGRYPSRKRRAPRPRARAAPGPRLGADRRCLRPGTCLVGLLTRYPAGVRAQSHYRLELQRPLVEILCHSTSLPSLPTRRCPLLA